MIKNIVENIENNIIVPDDIKYILNMKKREDIELIEEIIANRLNHNSLSLESNLYYPLIYKIEDNCPTCGYRTPISRQKYSEEFIVKNIEFKIKNLDNFCVSGINCYNKDISGLNELFIILNLLEKYDLKINVAISNYDNLSYLNKYDINSIIYVPQDFQQHALNNNTYEYNDSYEEKILKYIKENMKLKVTYLFTLNYHESHMDIFEIIMKIKKYGIDIVELKGFDPFIDSPEEYNPQYSKEYILKIIMLFKLYLPKVELKIQYASNNCNFIEDYLKLGINTITGIYTKNMNSKLENITELQKILKK